MDKMPDNLRWLAEYVSEWPDNYVSCDVIKDENTTPYGRFVNYYLGPKGEFNRADWIAARRRFIDEMTGHPESIMTESEEREYGPVESRSKYHVEIRPGVWVDVYDVLHAFRVTNPGDQHALKKILMPGKRGVKSANQDRREAILSLERAIELEGGE